MKTLDVVASSDSRTAEMRSDWEGNFELVEFTDVPEPIVAAHIPMQED